MEKKTRIEIINAVSEHLEHHYQLFKDSVLVTSYYQHTRRDDGLTASEHLCKVLVDHPGLKPYLVLANYETARNFKRGADHEWSQCLILEDEYSSRLIVPGDIIFYNKKGDLAVL